MLSNIVLDYLKKDSSQFAIIQPTVKSFYKDLNENRIDKTHRLLEESQMIYHPLFCSWQNNIESMTDKSTLFFSDKKINDDVFRFFCISLMDSLNPNVSNCIVKYKLEKESYILNNNGVEKIIGVLNEGYDEINDTNFYLYYQPFHFQIDKKVKKIDYYTYIQRKLSLMKY